MSSPSRRQYLDIKARHPDALLMYQVGDFFEFFDDDARVASRALRIVLTSRSFGQGERSPLCGVPLHAMEAYAGKLVAQGFKVAICEQVEPPGRGLVRREVTRVLTPGTVVEAGLLAPDRDNYLAAVVFGRRGRARAVGLAWVEASTGTFRCVEWAASALADAPPTAPPEALRIELERLCPTEVLVVDTPAAESGGMRGAGATVKRRRGTLERDTLKRRDDEEDEVDATADGGTALDGLSLTSCPPHYFDRESARVRLCRHFGVASLEAFGCADAPHAVSAAGAILAYLERMNPSLPRLISGLTRYQTAGFVDVDARTWAALEVVAPARRAPGGPTLLGTVDGTRTAMGARLLRRTVLRPLRDRPSLEARLDAVAALHADAGARQRVGAALDGMPDLERLAGRVARGVAEPRELYALVAALEGVGAVREALAGRAVGDLADALARLDPCPEVTRLIGAAVAPPWDGGGRLLRRGHSAELDALEDSIAASRRWLADLEGAERERTGIRSLHVTYNKVFGYAIEVTRPNLARVPPDYERRQTIATGERYVTAELREHEARVFQAEERITALERTLYAALLGRIAMHLDRLRGTGEALGLVDVRLALAGVAVARGYVRPELTDDATLEIRGGRHPVVESALDGAEFIANDTVLGTAPALDGARAATVAERDAAAGGKLGGEHGADDGGRILVLTGPNMAGKSTYLRQVAQIVLLAQMGSFVPARRARIGLVDRVFARVGADDDLAHGVSTFMGEMAETAYILGHATERSLVVLDEVGRGTSTHDGLAIARAVVEHLHDRVGARTLFATHFHELADLAATLPDVRLAAMEVCEQDGEVVFLHRLRPGGAAMSYGVHVARMAGLPKTVTDRAAALLAGRGDANVPGSSDRAPLALAEASAPRAVIARRDAIRAVTDATPGAATIPAQSPWTFPGARATCDVVLGLAGLNVAAMTPMDAINVLFAFQRRAAAVVREGLT